MSQHHIRQPSTGGICQECEHDLMANSDGYVYCTNPKCPKSTEAHPTRSNLNCPDRFQHKA